MGGRNPYPGQPPQTGSEPGEDKPTAAAEVVIALLPADVSPATYAGAQDGKLSTRLVNLMRRIGPQARASVPAPGTDEMFGVLWSVSIVFAWTVLMLGTLAMMVPAGMAARTIITVIALEFAGFVTGVLALRKRHKDS